MYVHVNKHLLDDICFHETFFSRTLSMTENKLAIFPSERPQATLILRDRGSSIIKENNAIKTKLVKGEDVDITSDSDNDEDELEIL